MKKLEIDIAYYDNDDLGETLEYIVSDIGLGLTRGQLNRFNGTHGTWRIESFDNTEIES